MTFKDLLKIIEENKIPKNVLLQSDSGWECDETEMNGVYYNKKKNTIIFTQLSDIYCDYENKKGWKRLSKYDDWADRSRTI